MADHVRPRDFLNNIKYGTDDDLNDPLKLNDLIISGDNFNRVAEMGGWPAHVVVDTIGNCFVGTVAQFYARWRGTTEDPNWGTLRTDLKANYEPYNWRQQNLAELMNLTQAELSINEYNNRFKFLLEIIPGDQLSPSRWVDHYVAGLKPLFGQQVQTVRLARQGLVGDNAVDDNELLRICMNAASGQAMLRQSSRVNYSSNNTRRFGGNWRRNQSGYSSNSHGNRGNNHGGNSSNGTHFSGHRNHAAPQQRQDTGGARPMEIDQLQVEIAEIYEHYPEFQDYDGPALSIAQLQSMGLIDLENIEAELNAMQPSESSKNKFKFKCSKCNGKGHKRAMCPHEAAVASVEDNADDLKGQAA